MKCKHRKTTAFTWDLSGNVAHRWVGAYASDSVDARVCQSCGAWLPLGPANDEDERVKVEIRAAELAVRKGFGSWANHGAGCERCGYCAAKNDVHDSPTQQCKGHEYDAGWLAHEIQEHKDVT